VFVCVCVSQGKKKRHSAGVIVTASIVVGACFVCVRARMLLHPFNAQTLLCCS
jgi:hypothetical protein